MKMAMSPLAHCLFAVLASASLLHASPQPIAFDKFEYAGRDIPVDPKPESTDYRNPILTGFYPDPSICQAGDDYYLVNSTFAYFPGIPIFHSRDLVNWEQLGNVIDRPQQLRYDGIDVSGAIFAPTIRYNRGTFYLVCTMVGYEGNFVVTATNPAGPWSDPTWLRFEGIDPSLFFDDDGRAWMVNNGAPEGKPLYDGHRAIWLQEFDPDAKKMIGPRKVLVNGGVDISKKPIWIEGPHLYKRDAWYYICCAEGGTGPQHSQVVLRSRTVDGPYTPWEQNPILTQRDLDDRAPGAVTSTGHADFVLGPDKNWWAIFLGVRPYGGRYSPMGRETFLLPVKWTDDGWPVILPKSERVPLVAKSPNGVSVRSGNAFPLNGDFTWSDDFNEPKLSLAWIMLRAPTETWWRIDPSAHRMELTPRSDPLSGKSNPSFLARRVQHAHFTASTSLALPKAAGVSAGLVVFQNEKHHYFLAVRRGAEGVTLFLERCNGSTTPEVIASTRLPDADAVKLRVECDDAKCSFSYATKADLWQTLLPDADARLLTSAVANGFVGATVGMHARLDP